MLHAEVLPEDGALIRSFQTVTETGELVSMEIRSRSEIEIGDLLKGALEALEESVDKTVLEPITIVAESELHAQELALLDDKRETKKVVETLKPFSDLAFTIHRTITGKTNEYSQYSKNRATVRDAAIVQYSKEREREQLEQEQRLRDMARNEDADRRAEDAAELERRSKAENRPDLMKRAEQIINEPAREVFVSTGLGVRHVKGHGGSVGLRKGYLVQVLDEEAFVLAIGRSAAYAEIVKFVKDTFGKTAKGKEIATAILEQAMQQPQIPTSMVEVKETAIKKAAEQANGRLNWPGIAIEEDTKTRTRTK